MYYILTLFNCILILNAHYHQHFNFNKPLFYDIPNANGIINHYRILYNADFIEVIPTQNAPHLSQDEIDLLMDNYDDIVLWKEKFPEESWILKGFGIITLIDVTVENAISNLKSNLLKTESSQANSKLSFESIFRSIFKISDIRIGVIIYNEYQGKFTNPPKEEKKLILNQQL